MKKSSCSSSSGAGFKFNFHRKKQPVPVTRALTTNSSLAPFYSVLFFRAPQSMHEGQKATCGNQFRPTLQRSNLGHQTWQERTFTL